jgi:hypothetical protein
MSCQTSFVRASKKQIWLWPIIAMVLLAVLAFGVRHAIETTMQENLRSELQTLLDLETATGQCWRAVLCRQQITNSQQNQAPVAIPESAVRIIHRSQADIDSEDRLARKASRSRRMTE